MTGAEPTPCLRGYDVRGARLGDGRAGWRRPAPSHPARSTCRHSPVRSQIGLKPAVEQTGAVARWCDYWQVPDAVPVRLGEAGGGRYGSAAAADAVPEWGWAMTSEQRLGTMAETISAPEATGAPPAPAVGSTEAPQQAPRGIGTATGVVVGVDDSNSARAAVAWAATAAHRRGSDLALVEVLPGQAGSPDQPGTPHGRARALLSRAQGIARAIDPGLTTSMHTLSGPVGPALVRYAAGASLLVVGSNGPGGPIPLSLGSILGEVTTHCECPVILVPPAAASRTRAEHAPILVALDDTPDGQRALEFAAETAHRRGATLWVLAADIPEHDDPSGPPADTSIRRRLAQLGERYPGLDIHTETVSGQVDDAMLRADANAQLIVVASRRRGAGLAGGWTRHFLPVLSTCPVAVVSTRTRATTTLA
jgi:nucleotide-binding universal stress UspA family protein